MAPKKKDSKNEEKQEEPPLQAVILSDTYEAKFAPLTLDRPRILLPLCGVPIIEYTLNFLASNGVEEVFLYLPASHVDQVDEYIQNSKWQTVSRKSTSPFLKLELIRTTSTSVGDCLRDLDARGTMKGDFLVVYGDLISTLDITPALQQHKARRLANKDRIFTTVLTKSGKHDQAHGNYTPVFTINPQTSRLLQYDQLQHSRSAHAMPLSADLFSDHQVLEVMAGLTDTGIDICTVDVLALWQDSFDLQDPRRQFLKLALRDYELNNKTFYAHITDCGYSARIRDLHSYRSVANDLISRRAYPFVPEMNMLSTQEFKLFKNKNYREVGVILHRQATVEKNSVIGQGTSIGADSFVTGSTIGRNCLIGRGVRIEDAHIFDNTSIGDFSSLKRTIIADEVVVGRRCEVSDSVLSWRCRLSDGISLVKKRIALRQEDAEETSEFSEYFPIVGEKGKGVEYKSEGDEPVEEDLGAESDLDSISTLNSDGSDADSNFDQRERSMSFISVDSDHAQESREFDKEASDNILDALNRGVEPENMLLELNSFRSSTNSSLDQVRRAVASGLWAYLNTQSFSPKKLREEIEKNQELVRRFTLNTKDQVEFLVLLQKDAAKSENPTLFKSLTFALALEDLVDAEGLKTWWDSDRSAETEALKSVKQPTEDVVQAVLKQAEESDESEEDGSEEDEDSD